MLKLSKRQKTILDMLLEHGLSNAQLAANIGISEHTVKVHLWRLYRRIDVNTRLEASRWWCHNRGDHGHNDDTQELVEALKACCAALELARARAQTAIDKANKKAEEKLKENT